MREAWAYRGTDTTTPYHGTTNEGHDGDFPQDENAQHSHGDEGQDEVHYQLVIDDEKLLRKHEGPREPERLRVKRGQVGDVSGVM